MLLNRILQAQSVAIVGASSDPRSFGGFVLANLQTFGYPGAIHLVSRSSTEINGLPCVDHISKLPSGIDLAVLAIPEAGVLDAIRDLGQRQVAAAVLFASGYAENGEQGQARQRELAEEARQAGVCIVGPNCMGFTHFAARLPVTFEPLSAAYLAAAQGQASGVAVVAQSGAMAAGLRDALLGRGLLPQWVFSTGNEAGVQAEDLVEHGLQDEAVRVLCVYAEQIRSPQRFLQLAARALAVGKPIALLMPGKSARAAAAAASHTGALAGDHAVASSLLRGQGVALVDTLDELIDTTAILARHPGMPTGGVAFMTGSGAMKNLALDLADSVGLPLPALQAGTVVALQQKLPAFAVAENPLDYTTIGVRQPGLIGEIVHTLLADPGVACLVLSIPAGPVVAQRDKAEHILPALAAASKPVVLVINGDDGPIEAFFVEAIRASRVPFFRSTDRALRALRGACAQAAFAAAARARNSGGTASPPTTVPLPTPGAALVKGIHPEYQGKAWLQALSLSIPRGKLARDAHEALQIAEHIGYPVVLKAQASSLPHKSEAGGVVVNLKDAAALQAGWQKLQASVAAYDPGLRLDGVLVEAMGAPGLELIVGARRDPQWGPVVMVGLGGIWIEALKDVRLLPPDLTVQEIVTELNQLKAAAVLRGMRGQAGVDLLAIARVVNVLAQQMLANPQLQEIDINPLVAYPVGSPAHAQHPVLALDALVAVQD
jgi:acetate---CoA ligase (ADP-forming)